ncbi:Integrase [Pseudomonas chlororaphis subsp. aureofaciens]|uniref:tyrosine-type recombinase/integrase n=1 Tax=Pseudomonas chlororaphis TaxID=587753 RepID=UPI000F57CA78|nr:integrase arm-type DNA-binding domain-containing protein [Pseudomonas chlororaphis]AZD84290.1 Integrase [Pseudomonas chlororaphis subsp. aureofaciens]
MSLTDFAIRGAKSASKPYDLTDTLGLCLRVSPAGGRAWHFRYYWAGKQNRISFGSYPEVSLQQARSKRDEARSQLARGINPRIERKQKQRTVRLASDNTFAAVFEQWLAHRAIVLPDGRQSTLSQIRRGFDNDVLPLLRSLSIYDVTRGHLLEVVQRIEARKSLSVAEKVRTWLTQMFRFALVVVPDLEKNPATDLDVLALPLPPVEHNPHLYLSQLPAFLQVLRKGPIRQQTTLAIRLLLLTGVRTGELRSATPDQFDLDRGVWSIPAIAVKQLKNKMRKERRRPAEVPCYIVPLCEQAQEIVRFLLARVKTAQRYLFPHTSDLKLRMSENTVNMAIKRLGYDTLLTGHGIRGTMSTALNEIGYPKSWIEAQLSHVDPNKVASAYNHAEYVEQRRVMMQDWADRLDLLEQGRLEAASTTLTVHLSGVSWMSPEAAAESQMQARFAPPVLLVSKPESGMVDLTDENQRLSAIDVPQYAQPVPTDQHRERMQLLEKFEAPHNVVVADYAKMAGKSRRWISHEVREGKLLALSMGNKGQRIPIWHLDPVKHQLINMVMRNEPGRNAWQIHEALSMPQEELNGRCAIDAVNYRNLQNTVHLVRSALYTADFDVTDV